VATGSEGTGGEGAHPILELGLDVRPGADGADLWGGDALVPPGACVPGTRFPLASVLVIYADMIAGMQARVITLPQMSVTVDLCVDILAPESIGRAVGEIAIESRLLRAGKRMIVTETTFLLPDGEPLGVCTGSFSAISRTHNILADSGEPPPPRHQRPLLTLPFAERVGVTSASPGVAELARGAGMGNSTDSLMGGYAALLGEMAALSRMEADTGRPYLLDRLHVRYLAPIRVGPARAVVRLTGGTPDRRLAFVEVRDTARPDEIAADITAAGIPVTQEPARAPRRSAPRADRW
jgi:acyl-coenzyme A thioesterase PaaI-like protein